MSKNISDTQIYKTLKNVFGFDSFREPQEQVIKDAMTNIDQLIMIPTGSGKSLCFQLSAELQGGISVVISPLKSLIYDQIENMNDEDIPKVKAVGIYSDISKIEQAGLLDEILYEDTEYKLIYTTPETIDKNDNFIETLEFLYKNGRLTRFVIDEAHCISLWGNDFRFSYRKLNILKYKFPNTPIMALTASATNQVQKDITYLLGIETCKRYTKSFYRNNLNIKVYKREKNTLSDIINKLKTDYLNSSGIVYCTSRKSCEKLADEFKKNDINADAFHAGLKPNDRKLIQNQWKHGLTQVIVATIAFGMGIDKPDVRFVIHYNMPSSLENYYQEIGRAGRDGQYSDCILYYSLQDKIISEKMLKTNFMSKNTQYTNHQVDKLNLVVRYATNIKDCRHCQLSNYLGELIYIDNCRSCDNCNNSYINHNLDVTSVVISIFDIIMKGSTTKPLIKNKLFKQDLFTSFKTDYNNDNLLFDRIINYLIVNKYIKETLARNDSGFWTENFQLFSKCKNIIDKTTNITVKI